MKHLEIIKIQSKQLLEFSHNEELFQKLLEEALTKNYYADPYRDPISEVWRGMDIDSYALRIIKQK